MPLKDTIDSVKVKGITCATFKTQQQLKPLSTLYNLALENG